MSDSDKDKTKDYFKPINPDAPTKSLEQLVEEGKISPKQLKSMLLMMQTGFSDSSSPEDALYIEKKTRELNEKIAEEEK